MECPSTCEHAGWFRDVRAVIDIIEITHGLPLPFISADRVTFYFTAITRADEARSALDCAREMLSYGLKVTFAPEPRRTEIGSAWHCIYTAMLPSGLTIDLVALARHVDGEAQPKITTVAPALAAAA